MINLARLLEQVSLSVNNGHSLPPHIVAELQFVLNSHPVIASLIKSDELDTADYFFDVSQEQFNVLFIGIEAAYNLFVASVGVKEYGSETGIPDPRDIFISILRLSFVCGRAATVLGLPFIEGMIEYLQTETEPDFDSLIAKARISTGYK